jgi:dipeptidase E
VFGVEARYDGLGVLDCTVVPHVGSAGRDGELVDETIALYRRDGTPFVPLCDGEVVVVDGDPAQLHAYLDTGPDTGPDTGR